MVVQNVSRFSAKIILQHSNCLTSEMSRT